MDTITRLLKYIVGYLERVKQTARKQICLLCASFQAFGVLIYLWPSRKEVQAWAGHRATAVIAPQPERGGWR